MKTVISTLALIVGLGLASNTLAQDPPSGGAGAKGNAPIKHMHTVNDGAAKAGANSFTQNEARKHIMNSGYTDVSGLAKGKDGVWRGVARKGDAPPVDVALDFKGNVSEGGPANAAPTMATSSIARSRSSSPNGASAASNAVPAGAAGASMGSNGASGNHASRRHGRRHHRHHMTSHCANPGANGVACSGQDRNHNGISDKEDRAMNSGAKP